MRKNGGNLFSKSKWLYLILALKETKETDDNVSNSKNVVS